ncbi:MAG TPA: hypothetical protein VHF02_03400 [Luteimonas sp.]|nr:hypothetical protein [Luteimonas sp.]
MRILFAIPVACLALAACNRQQPPAASGETATTASAPAAVEPASDSTGNITMGYSCDDGNKVEILGSEGARVTLSDGRVVDLPGVADSSPPAFAGEALSFAIGSEGGQLSQDEGGQWNCRPD